ncbi:MAG TPA: type VI secretion protein IcmF/TssM N-terminal domain-containing protein, partial [Aquella sp.]|nr:type VI secretion protein IcmF/TssM N-terminal domain-containing protein [Aquella sp.]
MLNTEYDQFINQLNNRLIWLLDQEKNSHRRSRLCFFPQQLLLLKEVIIESFVSTLMPNKLYELIEFRGVYFTSAVPQNNSQCDPLNFLIVKQFDLVPITHLDRITKTGGFFLKKLYRDLIIPEAGIVNYNYPFRKSKLIGNYFSYFIAIVLVVLGSSCLIMGHIYNKSRTRQAIAYLQQFERIESQFKDHLSVTEILPVLNVLKKAIDVYENDTRKWLLSYKLYQSPIIQTELKATLQRELEINLLPKIAMRLENLLLVEQNRSESLYDLFKAYLVLQDPMLLPKDWLKKAIEADWKKDEKISKIQKQELSHYLDFILGASFKPLALNQVLIEETMNTLLQDP